MQDDPARDPIEHYVMEGAAAGCNPNSFFDTRYYVVACPDVAMSRLNPFYHFLRFGMAEGRPANPVHVAEADVPGLGYRVANVGERFRLAAHDRRHAKYLLKRLLQVYRKNGRTGLMQRVRGKAWHRWKPWLPASLEPHWLDRLMEVGRGERNAVPAADLQPPGRIAMHIHLFYVDVLPEFLAYFRNIPYPVDLFISTPHADQVDAIRKQAQDALPQVSLIVKSCPNRGRDIASFVVDFTDTWPTYDFLCHIHTKRSPHSSSLAFWREYLLESLMGTPLTVAEIFRAFRKDPRLGIVFPAPYPPVVGFLNWGHNRPIAEALLERMGFHLNDDEPLVFPAGSMFWARREALQPLFDAGLSHRDFPREKGQVDGTMAHAIERSFVYVAKSRRYSYRSVVNQRAHYELELSHIMKKGAVDYQDIPECRPFLVKPVDAPRPRFNLLIPTINPSQAYGGISTALRLFDQIVGRLDEGIDIRIIPTAVPPFEEGLQAYPQAKPYRLTVPPPTTRMSIVDDAWERRWGGLDVRAGDVFMATAWSTAFLAQDIIRQQAEYFGLSRPQRLVYLIQDYEPAFHPWSARHAMAEDTYRYGENTIAIFNTQILQRYFGQFGYGFSEEFAFDPVLNQSLKPAPQEQEKQRTVLVYGRPQVARNCFDIISLGLAEALNITDRLNDWTFLSVGEKHADVILKENVVLRSLGKVSLQQYRDLLETSAVGISLMLSPHPSYPPLEMAHHNMLTLSNDSGTKRVAELHENLIPVRHLTPAGLAATLVETVKRFEANPRLGFTGKSHMPGYLDAQGEFSDIIDDLTRSVVAEMKRRPIAVKADAV